MNPEPQHEPQHKETLLILDDEPRILTALEDLFEDEYHVLTTSDARVALDIMRDHEVAIVLTDERMPGLSGHEFLKEAKLVSAATRMMISGYADIAALQAAINGGQIFAYVSKPWVPLELKVLVSTAMLHYKTVRAVERERALLRVLMDNIPDLIFFKDADSRYTRINREHAHALGLTDSEAGVGARDSDFFETEYASRAYEDEQQIVRSGQPLIDQVEKLVKADGTSCWISTTKVPIFNHLGAVSGIAGVSRDITNRKHIEEELREQSEHNRQIIDTAMDAFVGMDSEGAITTWNHQAEITFGWSASEVIGEQLSDIVMPAARREAHIEGFHRFLKTGVAHILNRRIEINAIRRGGDEFPIELMVWPGRSKGVLSFNAFIRDITERRQGEEALRKETTLMQLLQAVTIAANASSTIENAAQVCLERICRHTGWPVGHVLLPVDSSAGELLSAPLWYLEGEAHAPFRTAIEKRRFPSGIGLPGQVLASGKPEWIVNVDGSASFQRTRESGNAGFRAGFGFPILVGEKVAGVLEFFSFETAAPDAAFQTLMAHIGRVLGEVVKRQQAEEDLRRAKMSAESASRAKSEFLAVMSHEIRTPMNAILGMADLLSDTVLSLEQREYVRVFQGAGTNLLDIINDILDLSKVEAGRIELDLRDFVLSEVLARTVELVRARAEAKGLELTCEVLTDVPPRLHGDPDRLRQVLLNLIGNALKFTERGGITLRVEPNGSAAGELRFSVIDTGIGVAPDKTGIIFANFTQADSSTTRRYGGTGLGLAICKGLVELMGGQIGCTSKLDQGSTFFFTAVFELPVEETAPLKLHTGESAEAFLPGPAPAEHDGPIRILIAEDSDDNLFLIKVYLKDTGFDLDFAANGQIAVERFKSKHYDLVLMDVQMPVMDGHEATRVIRQWEALQQSPPVPILTLTAHALKEEAEKSAAAGCTGHLTKPINKETLLQAIAGHTGGKIRILPPKDVVEMVPGYLQRVKQSMAAMLAGVGQNDYVMARKLGHQWKGSGVGYGFAEITRAGAAVEMAAKDADAEAIRTQLLALANYLERVEVVT